jgi:hypothetical protein
MKASPAAAAAGDAHTQSSALFILPVFIDGVAGQQFGREKRRRRGEN